MANLHNLHSFMPSHHFCGVSPKMSQKLQSEGEGKEEAEGLWSEKKNATGSNGVTRHLSFFLFPISLSLSQSHTMAYLRWSRQKGCGCQQQAPKDDNNDDDDEEYPLPG